MPSIRKRGDRWMVIYRDAAGKQRSGGSFKSESEARKALRRTVDNVTVVEKIKSYSGAQLGSYAPSWLDGHVLEASSRHNYQGSLNTWIIPQLGEMKMGEITKADIRAWIQRIQKDGAGVPAIHKAFIVLSAMFATAMEDGDIKVNPCKGVKLPTMPKKLRRILNKAEYEKLLAEIPDKFKPLVQVAMGTGARFGELLALSPGDLEGDFLNITKTISYGKVKPHPKNGEHRRVKVSSDVAEIIRHFPDYSGQDPANFRTYYFNPAVKRAGLGEFTFHDLRHCHASMLLEHGASLQVVKERLGHRSLKTTERYLHTLESSQDAALAALEKAFAA